VPPAADYKAFLAPKEPVVLPYFGGTRVEAANRRLRLPAEAKIEPGWWRFAIEGRRAVPTEPASPVELGALPAVRGHWTDGWVVSSGRELGRIALPPEDEPPPLARVTARRWYSGELLLDSIDFEDDAEVAARTALEGQGSIAEVAGVVPSLRTAFALSLGTAVARELGVPISHRELAPHVVAIGDRGREAVRALLDGMLAERRAAEEAVRERIRRAEEAERAYAHQYAELEDEERREAQAIEEAARRAAHMREAAARATARQRRGDPADLADNALERAGARMLSARKIAHGARLEVRFVIDGVRITSTVDARTLQVLDAGICLAGADREVTLDSLPSVIREAIETDRLVITRHD
jgi:hypothetical protein